MDSDFFFKLSGNFSSSNIQLHMINSDVNYLDLIKGDYKKVIFPIKFKQEYGNKLKDMLNTGFASLYLISDKMKAILEQNKLNGWKTFPVVVVDKKGNEITGYHGFSVTGRCTSTSFAKSQIIDKQFVENGPICKHYKGIFIDGWDGSDFFSPDGESWIFISKNAADKLKKNKLSNIHLDNLSDYEVDIRAVK